MNLAKLRELASKKFVWTFLTLLFCFSFTAWLFSVENGDEIATILGLAVGVVALIANPTDNRTSSLVALVSAALIVTLGVLTYHAYESNHPLDATADVHFGEAASEFGKHSSPELSNGENVAISLSNPALRENLTISFEITNAPSASSIQDCRTDPETRVDLRVDGQSAPISLSSRESATIPVNGDRDIHVVLTMRAREGCRMQVYVTSAELHG